MWMFDGQQDSTYTLIGRYREYDYATNKVSDNPVEFKYSEATGYIEEVGTQLNGDFFHTTSGMTISSYANLPFKRKDVIIDHEGNEYAITSVNIEPDENFMRQSWADRRRYQRKTIAME